MYIKSFIAGLAFVVAINIPAAASADDTVLGAPQPQINEANDTAPADIAIIASHDPVAIPEIALASATDASTVTATDTVTVSDEALGELRGGHAIVIGNQTLSAINSGSIINGNYVAGSVSITDNALSNFNGLGNVLINTGALNNLQSAMNVTINFGD